MLKRRRQQQRWQTCCKTSQYWTWAVLGCSIWALTKFPRGRLMILRIRLKKKNFFKAKCVRCLTRSDLIPLTRPSWVCVHCRSLSSGSQSSDHNRAQRCTLFSLSLSVLVCFQLREALPLPSHGFIPVVMVTRCSLTDLNTPNWGLYHDEMYRNASHTARGVCRQF